MRRFDGHLWMFSWMRSLQFSQTLQAAPLAASDIQLVSLAVPHLSDLCPATGRAAPTFYSWHWRSNSYPLALLDQSPYAVEDIHKFLHKTVPFSGDL